MMLNLWSVSIFAALAVLVALSSCTARWGVAQLVRSVWFLPASTLPSALLARTEQDAWRAWESEAASTVGAGPREPLPIPELRPSDSAADVDLSRPLLARGLLSPGEMGRSDRKLSLEGLLRPPLSEIVIDYFRDARRVNTVPDGTAPLGAIVRNITRGGFEKLGTQMIIESDPELIREVRVAPC